MGRRRKRQKKVYRPKKVIPRIFQCPHCGKSSLIIEISKSTNEAQVKCGSCGLQYSTIVPTIFQPVDVYAKFLDEYHEGRAEIEFLPVEVEEEYS